MAAVRAPVVSPDSPARDAVKQAPLVRNCHNILPQRRCDGRPTQVAVRLRETSLRGNARCWDLNIHRATPAAFLTLRKSSARPIRLLLSCPLLNRPFVPVSVGSFF
jgi:hypothetical protein